MPVIQDQLSLELTLFQPANRLTGSSSRFGPECRPGSERVLTIQQLTALFRVSSLLLKGQKNIALLHQVIKWIREDSPSGVPSLAEPAIAPRVDAVDATASSSSLAIL